MRHQDDEQSQQRARASEPASVTEHAAAPGKRTRTERLAPAPRPPAPAPVQAKPRATADAAADAGRAERAALTEQWLDTAMRADLYPPPVQMEGGSAQPAGEVHALAARGISDAASALPHRDQVQRSFGAHDVSGIKAHVGGAAAEAARGMGAAAYATGDHVAFGDTPSLHTAAHEAAHVVQQRGGVQLTGGVGSAGDVYEEHADAVADAVVQGKSAERLLDSAAGGAAAQGVQQARQVQKVGDEEGTTDTEPTAPDLAAGELVLSRDPEYTQETFLGWFRDQVKTKIESWGLAFDGGCIRLATVTIDSVETKAILLTWPTGWGDQPATRDVPFTMAPIDAKASLAATHALSGWSKVASGSQGILDNVLGGETNQLSQKARDHLRQRFAGLPAQKDEDQAQVLEGLITAKEARPDVTNEPMATTPVTFSLAGPTEKKDYAFRGKKADAEEWQATFGDGTTLTIIAPKAPETGHHYHTVEQAADAASYLPAQSRKVIHTVLLNVVENPDDAHWAVQYNRPDFHSYMTAGAAGVVTIYPNASKPVPDAQGMRSSMVHETGHTWSYKTWGTDKTKGKWVDWQEAMDKDKATVSGYAMASIAEDVAETVQIYGSTKGSPQFAEYRRIVPNRFGMLDTEYV